ncbi:MAG: GerMN domain-containing protein, partial [Acidimicrobiia bacterium]
MRRFGLIITAFALLVIGCGGGTTIGDTTTIPPAAATTTAPAPTTTTAAPAPTTTAAPAPTTTAVPPPTTTAPVAPDTTAPREPLDLAVYLYIDEAGHPTRSGPFLVPVHRRIPYTTATAKVALEALLAAPNTDEASSVPALSTQIPADTTLRGVTVDDGVATVDLSGEFEADDDSAAVAMRIAQVVFTV